MVGCGTGVRTAPIPALGVETRVRLPGGRTLVIQGPLAHARIGTEADACDDLFARLDRSATARRHLLTWVSEKAMPDDFVAILLQAGISPPHRDAPAFANRSGIRYRIFVDGRDLEAANQILEQHPGAETGSPGVQPAGPSTGGFASDR